jgi:acyl carrier protein phosphodiesterase
MCTNCKSTEEAQARHAELEAAASLCQRHHTPENRERLRKANRAVWNIHNDYIFAQARERNEELRAQGVTPLYITHADKQPDSHASTTPARNCNMNRIVAVAPWGDTYSAQDAEDGCVPSEALFVEEVEG